MKKGKFTILIILLLAMIGLTSGFIAAWLTDTKTTPQTTFTVGDVEFTWNAPPFPLRHRLFPVRI